MIAGFTPLSCCGVTPFNVSTPSSNPLLANARKRNTTAYARNIRAPNTIMPAPLRKDCSLDTVSSLLEDEHEGRREHTAVYPVSERMRSSTGKGMVEDGRTLLYRYSH